MERSPSRINRDYNRSLARPVRWLHAAGAGAGKLLRPIWQWLNAPGRRWWAPPLLGAGVLFLIIFPFDGAISRWVMRLNPAGDFRRELEAGQQYGAIGSLVLAAAVIWLLNPARRRRLLDLACAAVLTGLAVALLKALVGRPRPKFGDPRHFLGPFGVYPLEARPGVRPIPELRHAWEVWGNISSDLWSFPSSHTAYAVVLSLFLVALYPRIRPLAVFMVLLVGICRVLFGAHYPTDVVAGAAVGLATAGPAVSGHWGVRAIDWSWVRFIDREARPAYGGGPVKSD